MAHTDALDLAEALGGLLGLLHQRVDAAAFDALMDTDLTLTQLRVVKALAHTEQPVPISELAEQLRLSIATAGRAVEHLVQHDLAHRWEDPEDRRSKLVRLTDQGTRLTEAPHTAAQHQLRDFAEGLPVDLARELGTAVRRALAAAAPDDAPTLQTGCGPRASSWEKSRPTLAGAASD